MCEVKRFGQVISCLSGVVLASGLLSSFAHAGAWVGKAGSGYGKIAYSQYSADEYFGDRLDLGEFNDRQFSYYGDYSITNDIAIFGKLLYQDADQSDNLGATTSNSGIGDVDIGIRYQWQLEPFVLATSFLAKLPYFYDENDALPLGNGQEDFEARVLIGKGLNQYGYFGAEFGYRLRTDAPSDEYRYLIEYGFSVSKHAYFRTKLDGIKSVQNADVTIDISGNLALSSEFDIGKLELTVGWNLGEPNNHERLGLELTLTDDIYGDQTLNGKRVEFALTRVF